MNSLKIVIQAGNTFSNKMSSKQPRRSLLAVQPTFTPPPYIIPTRVSKHNSPLLPTQDHILKVLHEIWEKGHKCAQLKKHLTPQQNTQFCQALKTSSFVHIPIKLRLVEMMQQKRIGEALRGLSRLHIGELQDSCIDLINAQLQLIQVQNTRLNQQSVVQNMIGLKIVYE